MRDAEALQQIPPARATEQSARKRGHRARAARFDRTKGRVVLALFNGVRFAFPVAAIPALRRAGPTQLAQVATNASGSTLRWDALDVDVSVAGLLPAAVDPAERLRYLASLAGRATSPAKVSAVRANGEQDGRRRKPASGATRCRS